MSCNHTAEKSYWVEDEDWHDNYSATGHWEYETRYTTVDIDLHRYKCTQCGEIMYYSGRARQHYEEAVKFDWITGLDK